jgi:hypothetical protein
MLDLGVRTPISVRGNLYSSIANYVSTTVHLQSSAAPVEDVRTVYGRLLTHRNPSSSTGGKLVRSHYQVYGPSTKV